MPRAKALHIENRLKWIAAEKELAGGFCLMYEYFTAISSKLNFCLAFVMLVFDLRKVDKIHGKILIQWDNLKKGKKHEDCAFTKLAFVFLLENLFNQLKRRQMWILFHRQQHERRKKMLEQKSRWKLFYTQLH